MAEQNIKLKVEDVSLTLGKSRILNKVSLSCERGRIYGLIGRNGSGKTMLMKCICGFIISTEGKILVYEDGAERSTKDRGVADTKKVCGGKQIGKDVDFIPDAGIIIETPGFIPNYSGMKNLLLLAMIKNRIGREEIRAAIEKVGLDPELKLPVRKYSLGMRQRLGLAQAIMEDPSVLILDEPMNGLDKEGVLDMRRYLLELKEAGKTILLTSHAAEDIELLCDEVYEMEHGNCRKVNSASD